MDGWQLLLNLLTLLTPAVLLGLVFERLRQSAIVGYLLAGMLVGPGALGYVRTGPEVLAIAEMGVAILLFTIGLEFSLKRLLRVGRIGIGGGTIQVFFTIALGTLVGLAFGLPAPAALAMAGIFAFSATAAVLQVLRDRHEVDAMHGRGAIAVQLMQDFWLVPVVLALPLLGQRTTAEAPIEAFGETMIQFALVVGVIAILTMNVIPRLLTSKAMARNRELPILIAVVSCLGAALAAKAIGVSPSLGTFVAGILLAESRYAEQIRADVQSLRTTFMTLFFASIGSLADLPWTVAHVGLVLTVTAVVIAGKTFAAYVSVRLFMRSAVYALAVAICLCQVGEFSFVLAQIALQSGAISEDLFQLVLSVTVLTLIATPPLVSRAPHLAYGFARLLSPAEALSRGMRVTRAETGRSGHVVIVGFGDAGHEAASRLDEVGCRVAVIEIDPRLANKASERGYSAVIGDASHRQILEHAGCERAACLVIAVPDALIARRIIVQAQSIAPHVPIVARARYHRFADELDVAGASVVVDEERLVGLGLGEAAALVVRGEACPSTSSPAAG